jgi:hypothetical protein
MYRERQAVADRYHKRTDQATKNAEKLQQQLTSAETQKDIARIQQEGISGRAMAEAEGRRLTDVQEQIQDTQKRMRGIYNDFLQENISDEAFVGGVREELRPYLPYLERQLKARGWMQENEAIQDFIDQALADASRTGRMDPLEAVFVALDIATARG